MATKAFSLLLLLSCSWSNVNAAQASSCRSSQTTIQWTAEYREEAQEGRRHLQDNLACSSQSLAEAKKDAWKFLRDHIMEFDKPKRRTFGFGGNATTIDDNTVAQAPDGLDQGLIGPTISLALQAKIDFPWTDSLPKNVFYEYVLNYAHVNEERSNWRPLLWNALHPLLTNQPNDPLTRNDVVRLVNQKLWSSLPSPNTIYFKHGLTPLIFDPFSIMVFGYASCTGLAILFVSALRTVGIAARVVGTPAWNSDSKRGNHNWVEIWDDHDRFVFLEPSANQTNVDDLTTKPCTKWFCNAGLFPATAENQTQVFAARLVFSDKKTYYPMPWEPDCQDVPGEDRSSYYRSVCSQC